MRGLGGRKERKKNFVTKARRFASVSSEEGSYIQRKAPCETPDHCTKTTIQVEGKENKTTPDAV